MQIFFIRSRLLYMNTLHLIYRFLEVDDFVLRISVELIKQVTLVASTRLTLH
jgi:hypothetical protein